MNDSDLQNVGGLLQQRKRLREQITQYRTKIGKFRELIASHKNQIASMNAEIARIRTANNLGSDTSAVVVDPDPND